MNNLLVEKVYAFRFTENSLNKTPLILGRRLVSHAVKEINGAYQPDLGKKLFLSTRSRGRSSQEYTSRTHKP